MDNKILLKSRSTKGFLIVYEDKVAVELKMLGSQRTNSMPYSRITGVEVKTTMAKIPLLSKGYATVIIYGQGDQKIEAPMVQLDDAQKAEEIINSKLQ